MAINASGRYAAQQEQTFIATLDCGAIKLLTFRAEIGTKVHCHKDGHRAGGHLTKVTSIKKGKI